MLFCPCANAKFIRSQCQGQGHKGGCRNLNSTCTSAVLSSHEVQSNCCGSFGDIVDYQIFLPHPQQKYLFFSRSKSQEDGSRLQKSLYGTKWLVLSYEVSMQQPGRFLTIIWPWEKDTTTVKVTILHDIPSTYYNNNCLLVGLAMNIQKFDSTPEYSNI